jgi:hypothetical protein
VPPLTLPTRIASNCHITPKRSPFHRSQVAFRRLPPTLKALGMSFSVPCGKTLHLTGDALLINAAVADPLVVSASGKARPRQSPSPRAPLPGPLSTLTADYFSGPDCGALRNTGALGTLLRQEHRSWPCTIIPLQRAARLSMRESWLCSPETYCSWRLQRFCSDRCPPHVMASSVGIWLFCRSHYRNFMMQMPLSLE